MMIFETAGGMTTQLTPYVYANLTMFVPFPEYLAGLMASMPADVGRADPQYRNFIAAIESERSLLIGTFEATARDLGFTASVRELQVALVSGGAQLTVSVCRTLHSGSSVLDPFKYIVDADDYDVSRVYLAWQTKCKMDWITAHNLRVANEP